MNKLDLRDRTKAACLLVLLSCPLSLSFVHLSSTGMLQGGSFKHTARSRGRSAAVMSLTAQDHATVIASEQVYMDGSFQPAMLSVRNGHIESINKSSCAEIEGLRKSAPGHDSVVVLQPNHLLLPAMVNGHAHLAMGAFRGITDAESFKGNVVEDLFFKLEGSLTEEDVRAFARMGCWESMLAGVGAAWEHYYFGDALASAFADTGFSGVIAPTIQDLSGPGTVLRGCDWEASMDTTISLHQDKGLQQKGIFAALGPHATDTISPSLWKKIASTAEQERLPLHSHVSQSIEEYRRSMQRNGCSPVKFLQQQGVLEADASMLLVHSMFVSSRDLELLDPNKHVLGLCPASAVQFGFPCNYQAWDAAGFKIALGTDAACSNDGMNVQQEMRLLAGGHIFGVMSSTEMQKFEKEGEGAEAVQEARQRLFDASLMNSPRKLFSTVSSNAGQMHPLVKMGEIREGSLANLLVVDRDHPNLWPSTAPLRTVCYANLSPCIQGLMVAGKWVGEVGNFQQSILGSQMFLEHRKEAEERLRSLLRSLNLVTQ